MSESDAYERALRRWASLAAKPMAEWNTTEMNGLVDQMQRLQLRLRESDDGRAQIERLARDEDARVRGWAATHVWKWDQHLAREVLTELRDGGGPGSFDAKWALVEIDSGSLNVDWLPGRGSGH
jgi:hypothetical protein